MSEYIQQGDASNFAGKAKNYLLQKGSKWAVSGQ